MSILDDILGRFETARQQANEANEKRFQQGIEIFDRMADIYSPTGSFGQGIESGIERGRKKAVSQGMQSLVSSGLASTTTAAGLGKRYEEEVAQPARERSEDIRFERLAGVMGQKAGFIERREDTGPNFSEIASLAQQVGRGQATRRAPRKKAKPWYGSRMEAAQSGWITKGGGW